MILNVADIKEHRATAGKLHWH
ncbi:TPA: hypothetical protein N0F65_012972 [Lagenidium giganteum]|uniref:Uncharacterized protein n=1 Tax=Lagenidium giganteum TaxID=4803 RepID=A0AAV2Z214_9STRA|nr:TPA: hypothetical protein N0F65_012972 [Lagenidium giganteum]